MESSDLMSKKDRKVSKPHRIEKEISKKMSQCRNAAQVHHL
jgi:hypothetical protein